MGKIKPDKKFQNKVNKKINQLTGVSGSQFLGIKKKRLVFQICHKLEIPISLMINQDF